nr:uncharacterized protein LOC129137679 isoform X2 [Pan troglodytes]
MRNPQTESMGSSMASRPQACADGLSESLPQNRAAVISRTGPPACPWAALSPHGRSRGEQNLFAPLVRLGKMPGDRIHPASDSIQSGAKASFNPPPSSQYKPKFWNKSFPTPPSEKLPGSRQGLLPSLQQEAQLANCRCAPGGHWMQGIDRWIPSIPPLHNHSAVNRRHFSAPQKLHADCEKEMLDGGVPGTTVREMVRELWMWNVE